MMYYFTQVCAGITVWWLIYRLIFRSKAAPKTNRLFLLGGLVLPFVFPLIPMSENLISSAKPILLPVISIDSTPVFFNEKASIIPWLSLIYALGFGAMLMYQFTGLRTFYRLKKVAKKDAQSNVYRSAKTIMPFSFFGTIFLPEKLPSEQEQLIVTHEKWHIKLGHSFDVAWAALVHATLWFFPLIPIYLRDLRTEHEYEVDERMLTSTAFSIYAETLLHVSLLPIGHAQFHSFSSPTLKNRIKMMTKKQKQNAWKLLLFVPLMGAMVYLNACSKQQEAAVEKSPTLQFSEVDVAPMFPECATSESAEKQKLCFNQGIIKQIQNGIVFPESAKEAGVQGTVYVGFTISNEGKIEDKNIKRSPEKTPENEAAVTDLEAAALAVFDDFPILIPASKDGNPVAIEYIVPINFQLPPKE